MYIIPGIIIIDDDVDATLLLFVTVGNECCNGMGIVPVEKEGDCVLIETGNAFAGNEGEGAKEDANASVISKGVDMGGG